MAKKTEQGELVVRGLLVVLRAAPAASPGRRRGAHLRRELRDRHAAGLLLRALRGTRSVTAGRCAPEVGAAVDAGGVEALDLVADLVLVVLRAERLDGRLAAVRARGERRHRSVLRVRLPDAPARSRQRGPRREVVGRDVAARQQIVQGAVGMVEMALRELSDQNIVQLDEERKAQMVSNLLVVLTSERGTQPVVNAGSLY